MQRLSSSQFKVLTDGADVIERDHFGEKVLRLSDETFLKLFRVKSMLSSAWLLPYSLRFAKNARELKARGVTTVEIIDCYRVDGFKRTAVHYRPLPGKNLREVLPQLDSAEVKVLAEKVARYIADLHDRGVYFRSLHMGNILQLPDGSLGLIDIADMRFYQGRINEDLRLRNFNHLARYERDVEYLLRDETFCSTYAALAGVEVSKVTSVIRGSQSQESADS